MIFPQQKLFLFVFFSALFFGIAGCLPFDLPRNDPPSPDRKIGPGDCTLISGGCSFGACPSVIQQKTGECSTDTDCKLIYGDCNCAAVPVSDSRTSFEEEMYCFRNNCDGITGTVTAVCKNRVCVVSICTK